jgi:hypothetical protein
MANFTVTSAQRITELAGKSGADSYSVNGGKLTIDCDSRYGPNQSATGGPLGHITGSGTLGGELFIDSSAVRLIPFSAGSGRVPDAGSVITQGAATAELLCVMANKTGGDVHTGNMPNSGWLKVRGTGFAAGALTGIGATATGPDETGWMVVVGAEGKSIVMGRRGLFNVNNGAAIWFAAGVTSGARGQTIQLPHFSADGATHYPGVEIETAPGSGVYAFWANVGTKFKSAFISDDSRSRYVHISATGLVTLGRGMDNQNAGDLPAAGCSVRVPNLILQSCGGNKAVNSDPSDSLSSRYKTSFAFGGNLRHGGSTGAWYWTLAQPHSVAIKDLHTCDQFAMSRCATRPEIDGLFVGLSTKNSFAAVSPISITQCVAGGIVGRIGGVRAECTGPSHYSLYFSNLGGAWTFADLRGTFASDCTSVAGSAFFNACDDVTVESAETVGKRVLVNNGSKVRIKRHTYADNVRGTTLTTSASHAVEVLGAVDCEVLDFRNWPGVANVHPYSGLVYASATRNLIAGHVGSPSAPYNAGTVNVMGQFFSDGGNNIDAWLRRSWLTALRSGLVLPNSSSTGHKQENCYTADASKTQAPTQCRAISRGNRHNGGSVPTNYTGTYGTPFWDAFTGDTTARLVVAFTEPMASDGTYTLQAGNPQFTGSGGIVMAQGDAAVWEMPAPMLGWTGLTGFAVSGSNTALHTIEYDIDRGAGFTGAYQVLTTARLAAEQITPTGFRLRLRITCTASNYSNQLTSVRIDGSTTLAAQNAALYPLDVPQASLMLTGLQFGSHIAVALDGDTVFSGSSVTATASISYPDRAARDCVVTITKAGYHTEILAVPNARSILIPVHQHEAVQAETVAETGDASDIAAAVQARLLDDFAAIDARLSNQMHDAYDPNKQWYVITRNGEQLIGVTTDDPTDIEWPEGYSIAQMSGQVPDLNFNVWDYGLDQFKSSLPTRVAFLSRFTVAELVAIRASTDQVVKDIMSRIDVLRYINLQEQLTVDSVAYFAQVGLIAPERAAEVTA